MNMWNIMAIFFISNFNYYAILERFNLFSFFVLQIVQLIYQFLVALLCVKNLLSLCHDEKSSLYLLCFSL